MKARSHRRNSLAPAALVLLMLASNPAHSDSFIVTTAIDATIADADLSLREALDLANLNPGADIVEFDGSLSGATITLADGELTISDHTTINGSGQIVDAAGLSRVMFIESGVIMLLGSMTLTNGMAGTADDGFSNGGGIFIDSGASVALTQVNITHSRAYSGGAIAGDGAGPLTINGGVLSNNSAVHAGGAIEFASAGYALNLNQVSGSQNAAGPAPGDGGFLYLANGGIATIIGGEYLDNKATRNGGAVYNSDGSMTVSGGTIISGNEAEGTGLTDGGGGLFQDSYGKLTIDGNVQILDNVASGTNGSGGGILNLHELDATDVVIRGNSANRAGGGVSSVGNWMSTLTRVALSNNDAGPMPGQGGGVYVGDQSLLDVRESTFTGNSATSSGGGIYSSTAGVVNLFSSTVSGNSSPSGAGVTKQGVAGSMALISMTIAYNMGGGVVLEGDTTVSRNSIFSDNSGGDCSGVDSLTSVGANLFGSTPTCILSGDFSDIIGISAQLHALSDNGGSTFTHLPMPNSPVLDSGNCLVEMDQRGMPRPIDLPGFPNSINGCDIGAVERQVMEDIIFADGFDPTSRMP